MSGVLVRVYKRDLVYKVSEIKTNDVSVRLCIFNVKLIEEQVAIVCIHMVPTSDIDQPPLGAAGNHYECNAQYR